MGYYEKILMADGQYVICTIGGLRKKILCPKISPENDQSEVYLYGSSFDKKSNFKSTVKRNMFGKGVLSLIQSKNRDIRVCLQVGVYLQVLIFLVKLLSIFYKKR